MNYSNNATRAKGTGWDAIQEQIAKLEKRHAYHIAQYGEVRAGKGRVMSLCVQMCNVGWVGGVLGPCAMPTTSRSMER